jgi:hypothetical protein
LGFDPLINNPAMPTGNVMNYPRTWFALFYMGVDQSDTVVFALVLIAFYLFAIFLLVRECNTTFGKFLLGVLSVSSPSVLAMERGNIDMLIFFLMVVAGVLYLKNYYFSSVIIFISFSLKLFTIFALSILLFNPSRRKFFTFTLVIVLCFIGLFYFYDDIQLISRGTPRSSTLSFGYLVSYRPFFREMMSLFPMLDWSREGILLAYKLILASLILGSIFMGFFSSRCCQIRSNSDSKSILFIMGALIYFGVFIVGNNWDYRLIFLFLLVPLLTSGFAKSVGLGSGLVGFFLFVIIFLMVNMSILSKIKNDWLFKSLYFFEEFISWVLFVLLTYCLSYSFFSTWRRRIY